MTLSKKLFLALTTILLASTAFVVVIIFTLQSQVSIKLSLEGKVLRQKAQHQLIFASMINLQKTQWVQNGQKASVKSTKSSENFPAQVSGLSNEFSLDDTRPMIYFENTQPLSEKEIFDLKEADLKLDLFIQEATVRDLLKKSFL